MFNFFKKKVEVDPYCLTQAVLQTTNKLRPQFDETQSLYQLSNDEIAAIIGEYPEAQMMFLSFASQILDYCLQDAYHDKNGTRDPSGLPNLRTSMLPSLRMVWDELIDDPLASVNLRYRYQKVFERGLMDDFDRNLLALMNNISSQSELHFTYEQPLDLTWLKFIVSLKENNPDKSMGILRSKQMSMY